MTFVTVTRKENVQDVTDSGEIILIDETQVGYCRKVHASVVSIQDENGNPQLAFVSRVEVFWEDRRNPAPSFDDPNDLVWLDFGGENQDDEQDEQDIEEIDEDSDAQTSLL